MRFINVLEHHGCQAFGQDLDGQAQRLSLNDSPRYNGMHLCASHIPWSAVRYRKGRFQPTVCLSICTVLADVTLTYALYQGVVVSFWRKACQGATLTELHQLWDSVSSLVGTFNALIRMCGATVALACITTVVSVARGPLMQGAASVANCTLQQNGSLTIYFARQLPIDNAGVDTGRTVTPSLMNPNFTDVVQA